VTNAAPLKLYKSVTMSVSKKSTLGYSLYLTGSHDKFQKDPPMFGVHL